VLEGPRGQRGYSFRPTPTSSGSKSSSPRRRRSGSRTGTSWSGWTATSRRPRRCPRIWSRALLGDAEVAYLGRDAATARSASGRPDQPPDPQFLHDIAELYRTDGSSICPNGTARSSGTRPDARSPRWLERNSAARAARPRLALHRAGPLHPARQGAEEAAMRRSFWIGFDPREQDAFAIAVASISATREPVDIMAVDLKVLQRRGSISARSERRGPALGPISDAPMSTEFAISRFFVPCSRPSIATSRGTGRCSWTATCCCAPISASCSRSPTRRRPCSASSTSRRPARRPRWMGRSRPSTRARTGRA
jgi:hypothetical protein